MINSISFNYPGIFWLIFIGISTYLSLQLYKDYSGRYKGVMISLRIILLLLISTLIFKPIYRVKEVEKFKKRTILLIDNSSSMGSTNFKVTNYENYDLALLFGDSLRPFSSGDSLFYDKRSNIEDGLKDTLLLNLVESGRVEAIDLVTDGWFTNSNRLPASYDGVKINFLLPTIEEQFDLFIKDLYISYEQGRRILNITPSFNQSIGYLGVKIDSSGELVKDEKFDKDFGFLRIDISEIKDRFSVEVSSNRDESNRENNRRVVNLYQKEAPKKIALIYKKIDFNIKFLNQLLLNRDLLVVKNPEKIDRSFDLLIHFGENREISTLSTPTIEITDRSKGSRGVIKRSSDPQVDFLFRDQQTEFSLSNFPDLLVDPNKTHYSIPIIETTIGNRSQPILSTNSGFTKAKISIVDLYTALFTTKGYEDKRFETILLNLINIMTDRERKENIKILPEGKTFITGDDIIFKGVIIDPDGGEAKELSTIVEFDSGEKVYLSYKNGIYDGRISFTKGGEHKYKISALDGKDEVYSREGSLFVEDYNPEDFTLGSNPSLISALVGGDSLKTIIDDYENSTSIERGEATYLDINKDYEISLYRNHYILIAIILLLTTEWIIRKIRDLK